MGDPHLRSLRSRDSPGIPPLPHLPRRAPRWMFMECSSPDQSQGIEAPDLNPYRLPGAFSASNGKWNCVFREQDWAQQGTGAGKAMSLPLPTHLASLLPKRKIRNSKEIRTVVSICCCRTSSLWSWDEDGDDLVHLIWWRKSTREGELWDRAGEAGYLQSSSSPDIPRDPWDAEQGAGSTPRTHKPRQRE